MLTAFVLTVLAVLFRVFSATYQVWNFAPMAAISLYAGSRLPRRWAWVVPVVAMVVSDLLLDQGRYRPAFELTRWTIYTTFAVTTLLGPLANWPRFGRWLLRESRALSTPVVTVKNCADLALTIAETCQSLATMRSARLENRGICATVERLKICR